MSQATKRTDTVSATTGVHRSKVIDFIKALGFDPNEVSQVEITPSYIYVTSYLKNEQGQIYLAKDGMNNVSPATETSHVEVQD